VTDPKQKAEFLPDILKMIENFDGGKALYIVFI
jgi:hypothetical protein